MSASSPVSRRGLPSRWHVLLHVLAVGAGWLLFGLCWWLVLQQPRDSNALRNLIIGAAIVMPTLTLAWIVHNVGIHRRKGPRRAGAVVPLVYDVDFNGRRIEADWPALQRTRSVIIERTGDVKRYHCGNVPRVLPASATDVPAAAKAAAPLGSASSQAAASVAAGQAGS